MLVELSLIIALYAGSAVLIYLALKQLSTVESIVRQPSFYPLAASGALASTASLLSYYVIVKDWVLLPVVGIFSFCLPFWITSKKYAYLKNEQVDALLEAIQLLKQLIEAGGVGLNKAIEVLGESGPVQLRKVFRDIHTGALSGEFIQAWTKAARQVDSPIFDYLCLAAIVQRSTGAPIVPIVDRLGKASRAAVEIQREVSAMQSQSRSAARMILLLPLTFLFMLSLLHSSYLNVYHTVVGELYLMGMVSVMWIGYRVMLKLMALPTNPRLQLAIFSK